MIYAIAVVLILIFDQGLKLWTVSNIALNTGEVPLIDGIIHLTHLHNYGAAFSMLQDTRWLLVGITVIFVGIVIFALTTERITSALGRWSAIFVMAGAIGNGIDRVMMGYVVDMFEFEFIIPIYGQTFPVFNIADIFVTVFGVLFCIYIICHKEDDAAQYEPSPEPRENPLAAKLASRKKEKKPAGRREAPAKNVGRREAPAKAKRPAPKVENAEDIFAEWEAPKSAPAYEEPVAPVYEAPVRRAEPAYTPSSDSLDLEDILAEFRD